MLQIALPHEAFMSHPLRRTRRVTLPVTLAVALLVVPAASAHAQAASKPATTAVRDSAKADVLRRLLQRVQAAEQALSMMEASLPAQRAATPRVPAVFWDRMLSTARERKDELNDMIAGVYDRHFSTEELRQLLAFYETPLGRKLLASQPSIMQESMVAGQEWGRRIGETVATQLAAEGVKLEP
jgi:uncharacterized protein